MHNKMIKKNSIFVILLLIFVIYTNKNIYYANVIISSRSNAVMSQMNGPGEKTVVKNNKLDNPFLILINHIFPLDLNYVPPLTKITGGQKMHKAVAPIVEKILKDAAAEGITLAVVSGYRSSDRQGYLFNKKFVSHKQNGKDDAKAFLEAIKVNPIPGTSEHQSGLCMDIVDINYKNLDEKQEETEGYKWMLKNCAKYGFILRYPKNKTDITGIIYEPWHFRYVGIEAANEIMSKNLTLEEYVLIEN